MSSQETAPTWCWAERGSTIWTARVARTASSAVPTTTSSGAELARTSSRETMATTGCTAATAYRLTARSTPCWGTGNDVIHSENADLIDGGPGDDFAFIDRQNSAIAFKADFAEPDRTAIWADGTVISGIERVQFLGGAGADVIRGGNGTDYLISGGGADQLWGGGGIDVLNGGSGRDRLVGGADTDFFVFYYGTNRDRIIDFVQGEDVINLDFFGVNFDRVIAATSRNDANGIVTIDLALLNGAPADRIEILTDPTESFHFTRADFDLIV